METGQPVQEIETVRVVSVETLILLGSIFRVKKSENVEIEVNLGLVDHSKANLIGKLSFWRTFGEVKTI